MKKQLLLVVITLAAMAMLSAFTGQQGSAILCAVMAGIGGLIAAFGRFQKGFRCACANCGVGVFVPKQVEAEAKASLEATGWRCQDSREHCPACSQQHDMGAATQSTSH